MYARSSPTQPPSIIYRGLRGNSVIPQMTDIVVLFFVIIWGISVFSHYDKEGSCPFTFPHESFYILDTHHLTIKQNFFNVIGVSLSRFFNAVCKVQYDFIIIKSVLAFLLSIYRSISMTLCVDETEIRDSESLNGINSMSHRHKHYILVISSALLLKLRHMETMILQNYSEQYPQQTKREEGMNINNSIEITLFIYCHVLSQP